MGMNEIAAKVAGSKVVGGGNFIRDGRGVLIVKSIKCENLFEGDTFIVELLVESSQSLPDALDAGGRPVQANPPGSTVTFLQQFAKFPQTAFGNTKGFILRLMDEPDETADPDVLKAFQWLCSKENPGRGMRINYSTYRKWTKDKSKLNTYPRFESVPNQTPEMVKAARAMLDKTDLPA